MQEAFRGLFDYLGVTRQYRDAVPADVDVRLAAFADRPVFLCGCMKAGTTLLTQLLDDHPQLMVMPGDSHLTDFIEQREYEPLARHWLGRLVSPTGKTPSVLSAKT